MKWNNCFNHYFKWTIGCYIFLAACERKFETLGRVVAGNPKKTIFISLALVLLCGLGLLNLSIETETEKLYVPANSQAEKDLIRSKPHFLNLLNSRKEEIILEQKQGLDLFTPDCIKEAKQLINSVISSQDYKHLCVMKLQFFNSTDQYSPSQPCLMLNPYELILNNSASASSIITAAANNVTLMSNGRLVKENWLQMFSGRTIEAKPLNKTKAIRVVFYLQEDTNKKLKERILSWEESFVKQLKKEKDSFHCAALKYSARRSLDDAIGESAGTDFALVSIAFTMMITFACTSLSRFTNPIRGHSILANFGILSTAFGILAGFGFTMLIGVPFTSIVGILPFLVLSIGIDDMFIIVDEFDNQDYCKRPNNRVANTMAKIGATITMTTVTDIVAFAVSATSVFPAIKYFCIFAAITFTTEFFLQITLFIAFLSFDARRISALRRDCLPFCRGEDKQICSITSTKNLAPTAMEHYAKVLLTTPAKIIVMILSITLLGFGIFGCMNVSHEFNRRTLIKDDFYLLEYLNTFEKEFQQTMEVNLVLTGKHDYSIHDVQKQFLNAPSLAYQTGYYESYSRSWVEIFQQWSRKEKKNTTGADFTLTLKEFLSLPMSERFKNDIKFDSKGQIVATQIQVYMKETTKSTFQRDAMLNLRKAFKNNDNILVPTSDNFIFFEQFAAVSNEVIRNICLSAVIIVVTTLPFCIHLPMVLILLVSFVALLTELIGLMYFWNVSLSSVSMICLVMSIGFTVDYSAHVAHAFVTSNKPTVDGKIVEALGTVGASVLTGGISTFLGMVTTAFAASKIFQIFFKMFFGIVVFGLFNGLVLIPVILSVFGCFVANDITNLQRVSLEFRSRKIRERKVHNKSCGGKIVRKPKLAPYISIVGISARFPTARNKEEFWKLLLEGRNTLSDFPESRQICHENFKDRFHPQRGVPGRLYVTAGSYMEDVDKFDNNFFGISHQEATMMDPQQRLLLQAVFEAIEDAGLTLQELQFANTGVYVGAMNFDYSNLLSDISEFSINQFAGTGTSSAIIANRISYSLNLKGPSVCMDTACSSSFTALNMAYEHLKNGKCDYAIVGAANIIVDKLNQLILCQANMLAPDGQCKSFDARCDGYGRGEGIVVVILKPTSVEQKGDGSIYCNILACSLNNDGQTAIPITAPSEAGQSSLFLKTCMEADILPQDIDYLEAHGTGTVIGDRVETRSISLAYCQSHTSQNPLRIGSVKSNINHTESTAGLAGLAKVCLMIEKEIFVPTVGIKELNSSLNLEDLGLVVQQIVEDWTSTETKTPRTAAINSFGFGGSNAHVIVQDKTRSYATEIDEPSSLSSPIVEPKLLVLSARTKQALLDQAKSFSNWLTLREENPQLALDVCYSLSERRTAHNHRLSICFKKLEDVVIHLNDFSKQGMIEKPDSCVNYDRVRYTTPKIGFAFGGQGSDWSGMISNLSEYSLLRKYFGAVDEELKSISLPTFFTSGVLSNTNMTNNDSNSSSSRLQLSELTRKQIAIFKVQYALSKVLIENCGILPTAVVGHSMGDITAAAVAGCISLHNALCVIVVRSELQNKCRDTGKMAAVGLSATEMQEIINLLGLQCEIEIAAINDQSNVTISGDAQSIAECEKYLLKNRENIFWRNLATDKAYHSRHMDAMKERFLKYVKRIHFLSDWTTIQFISSVFAKPMTGQQLKADYWWENVRNPVQFMDAIKEMLKMGCRIIVEVSPRPVVLPYVKAICKDISSALKGDEFTVMPALPRINVQEKIDFLFSNCIGHLYNIGCTVTFPKLMDYQHAKFIRYPTYAWQETSFWAVQKQQQNNNRQRLLGDPVGTDSDGHQLFESPIDCCRLPFLADHQISGTTVYPGACYVETFLEAAIDGRSLQPVVLKDITFDNLLTLSDKSVQILQTTVQMSSENSDKQVMIYDVTEGKNILLATCSMERFRKRQDYLALHDIVSLEKPAGLQTPHYQFDHIKRNPDAILTREEMRDIVESVGVTFGESFSLTGQTWKKDDNVLCQLDLPKSVVDDLPNYVVHPSIIDAVWQCLSLAENKKDNGLLVPIGMKKLVLFPCVERTSALYVFCKTGGSKVILQLMTEEGYTLLMIEDLQVVNLSNRSPKFSMLNSTYEVYPVPGLLSEGQDSSKGNCQWIIVGVENEPIAKMFYEYQKQLPGNQSTFVQTKVHKFSKTTSKTIKTIIQAANEDGKCCILVQLVPITVHSISQPEKELSQRLHLLYLSCFELLQELCEFDKSKLKLIFVTTEDVTSPETITGRRQRDDQVKFPIASLVWGFCRSARMEQPSMAIRCADIRRSPSEEDTMMLARYCLSDQPENDIIIRGTNCYFPRAYLSNSNTDNEVMDMPSSNLINQPHYFTMREQELLIAVDDSLLNETVSIDSAEIKVEFVSSATGSVHNILYGNHLVKDTLLCYSGTIINAKDGIRNSKVLTFQRDSRIQSTLHVNLSNTLPVPDGISMKQAAAVSGCLALASKVIKHLSSAMKSSQSCLITTEKQDANLGLSLMLAAKALNWDVSTTDVYHPDIMAKLGVGYANMHDFLESSEFNDESPTQFDSIIVPFGIDGSKFSVFLRAVRPGGYCLVINTFGEGANNYHNVLPVNSKQIDFGVFHCSKVSQDEIMKEWKLISPHISKKDCIWSALLLKEIYVIDPYMKTRDIEGKRAVQLNALRVNQSSVTTVQLEKCILNATGFRKDRTYVVVGGHKGLGLETSLWLANRGAGVIVTCGRSALLQSTLERFHRHIDQRDFQIHHVICDVTTAGGIEELQSMLQRLPKLAGIINSAAVFDDRLMTGLTYESFQKVTGPKVTGTILLWKMTSRLNIKLDFFILYSSVVSAIGNFGQCAYSAANFFLNQFANLQKHLMGENFLSVCWGPMSGAGVLSQNEELADSISERFGLYPIPVKTGLIWLESVLMNKSKLSTVMFSNFDWHKIANGPSKLKTNHVVRDLIPKSDNQTVQASDNEWRNQIKETKSMEDKWLILKKYFQQWLATWIGTCDDSEVDLNAPLSNYGLDSAGAFQFHAKLEEDFQVDLLLYDLLRPDSNSNYLINTILKKIEHSEEQEQPNSLDTPSHGPQNIEDNELSKADVENEEDCLPDIQEDFLELAYSPPHGQGKFFLLHPSHRYRGILNPVVEGFKTQNVFEVYSFGSDDMSYMVKQKEQVRTLAKEYLKIMSYIQPRGPYFLGGYSFGGLIALEMASILTERKEAVALLVMIDTLPYVWPSHTNSKLILSSAVDEESVIKTFIKVQFRNFLRNTARMQLGIDTESFNELFETKSLDDLIKTMNDLAQKKSVRLPEIDGIHSAVSRNTFASAAAAKDWVPPKVMYKGPVLFIQANDSQYSPSFPGFGSCSSNWERLIKPSHFFLLTVPGDHFSLLNSKTGVTIGKVISTMARFMLGRKNLPMLTKIVPGSDVNFTSLQQGIVCTIVIKGKGLRGILKVDMSKAMLKFKGSWRDGQPAAQKIFISLRDVVNIIKTTDDLGPNVPNVSMGFALWTTTQKHVFFFEDLFDYTRAVRALESIFRIQLPLL